MYVQLYIYHTKFRVLGGYDSLKLSEPVEQLVETCAVLPSTGALSNEGGVGREDHPLSHPAIALPTDFPIVELNVIERGWTEK